MLLIHFQGSSVPLIKAIISNFLNFDNMIEILTYFLLFVIRVLRESKVNLLSKNICYLKISFGMEKGKIDSFSINAPYVLNIEKTKLSKIKNVNELIPSPIDKFHNSMIISFFNKGDAAVFR